MTSIIFAIVWAGLGFAFGAPTGLIIVLGIAGFLFPLGYAGWRRRMGLDQ